MVIICLAHVKIFCRYILLSVAVGVGLCSPAAGSPREAGAWEKKIDVGLKVAVDLRNGADIPIFTVSIRNISSEPVSVIDIRGSAESQDRHAWIRIAALDPMISVGVRQRTSQGARDSMIELAPGEGYEFTDKYSDEYWLGRGRYRAQVTYTKAR